MKTTPTWIMVSDGAVARVYDYKGPKKKLQVVEGTEFSHVNLPNRELDSTKPGRFFDPGEMRSADSRHDSHEQEKKKFANELGQFLDQKSHKFARLILAAPPKMLGYLRDTVSKNTMSKVIATIDKDLTKASEESMEKHMQDYINIDVNRVLKETSEPPNNRRWPEQL